MKLVPLFYNVFVRKSRRDQWMRDDGVLIWPMKITIDFGSAKIELIEDWHKKPLIVTTKP